MGGRCADGDYARFLEAAIDLADTAAALPRRARLGLAVAILTVCESERLAQTALCSGDGLRRAVSGVRHAREVVADVDLDLRRRRTLSLVS